LTLIRTDVSEELSASITGVTLMMEALGSSETSDLTRASLLYIPDDIRMTLMMKALSSSETSVATNQPHCVTFQTTAFFIVIVL
jgi:hypothetical protein